MVIQMNWPLPARGISITQLGTVRGILRRNKSKAGRGSLLANVPVLTEEETFARGNTVGQGLKQRFPTQVPECTFFPLFFLLFCLCFQRKLFALMPLPIVVLEHSFGKQRFSSEDICENGYRFWLFRTSSFY